MRGAFQVARIATKNGPNGRYDPKVCVGSVPCLRSSETITTPPRPPIRNSSRAKAQSRKEENQTDSFLNLTLMGFNPHSKSTQPEELSWNHGWTLMNADKTSQKPDMQGFR